jgi:hypothetical protein
VEQRGGGRLAVQPEAGLAGLSDVSCHGACVSCATGCSAIPQSYRYPVVRPGQGHRGSRWGGAPHRGGRRAG